MLVFGFKHCNSVFLLKIYFCDRKFAQGLLNVVFLHDVNHSLHIKRFRGHNKKSVNWTNYHDDKFMIARNIWKDA